MPSVLYWLTSTIIALLCIKAAATQEADAEMVASALPQAMITAPADNIRAILLGIGIMAVAYTYRCVWMNFASAHDQ
jgi:hypothetical protein